MQQSFAENTQLCVALCRSLQITPTTLEKKVHQSVEHAYDLKNHSAFHRKKYQNSSMYLGAKALKS